MQIIKPTPFFSRRNEPLFSTKINQHIYLSLYCIEQAIFVAKNKCVKPFFDFYVYEYQYTYPLIRKGMNTILIETNEYLKAELTKCEAWEKNQSDLWFWEKLGRLPFKLLDRWTPSLLQEKMAQTIDELGQYIQSGGRYLSSTEKGKSYYAHLPQVNHFSDIASLPLSEMDNAAQKLMKSRKKMATVQGASTGIGGIFTLSLDIPLLLGLQLKTLQDMAICYGYDPTEENERIFILKCLQFVSSDIVGKQAILKQLSLFDSPNKNKDREVIAEIQGWREVIMAYREQIGWKKLFQMIPITGLLFGAFINRSTIHDLSESAMILYRKRKILERLALED